MAKKLDWTGAPDGAFAAAESMTEQSTAAFSSGLIAGEAAWVMLRRNSELCVEWATQIAQCRSPMEVMTVNAKVAAKAQETFMALAQEMVADVQTLVHPNPGVFETN